MDATRLKRIISDQREEMEEILRKERMVERSVDREKLKGFLSHPNILAILGVRRSGKSVFSWMLMKGESFGYVNFFDERLADFHVQDFESLMGAFYELYGNVDYLIFDEIQNITGWERFLSRMRSSKRIIITGSNSQMLSGELATYLTGRYVDFELFPFDFREHLAMSGIELEKESMYSTRKAAELRKEMERYIEQGGFPEAHIFGKRMIQNIYHNIIENDVLRRYEVKKTKELKDVARYLISNFSGEFTYSKLGKVVGLRDPHTVSRYVDYLRSAYLIFPVERFSYKLKEQMLAPKKIYAIDTGLINAISFGSSENIGRLMENLVFIELMRRRSYSFGDEEIYYWKDHRGREVDFVIKKGNSIQALIQVTFASSEDDIENREKEALMRASDELGCRNLRVITWDYEGEEELDGKRIRYVPLWLWMMT